MKTVSCTIEVLREIARNNRKAEDEAARDRVKAAWIMIEKEGDKS